MVDLLSQPIWDGIGALIGFMALIIAIVQFRAQRSNQQNNGSNNLDQSYRPGYVQQVYSGEIPSYPVIRPMVLMIVAFLALIFIIATPPRSPWTTTASFRPILPPTAIPTQNPKITVVNHLAVPVDISINNTLHYTLAPAAQFDIPIEGDKVAVLFNAAVQKNADGIELGERLAGFVDPVTADQTINITNVIGVQYYFFPIITNTLSEDCSVVVNKGTAWENKPQAYIPAKGTAIGLGYYRLFNESNIVLDCGNFHYWYGIRKEIPNDQSIVPFITQYSGIFNAKLSQ